MPLFFKILLLPFALFLLFGCKTSSLLLKQKGNKLERMICESECFNQAHSGFALYDPSQGEFLARVQDKKYFTPASNTKIITFYAADHFLDEKIIGLRFEEKGDTIFFQGTGDPSFLNPEYEANQAVFEFLKNTDKTLVFNYENYQDKRFGAGWSWDDFRYLFQAEKCAFPIYGNVVRISRTAEESEIKVQPSFFRPFFQLNPDMEADLPKVSRDEHKNRFYFNSGCLKGPSFQKEIPFVYAPELFVKLLADTLNKEVLLDTNYSRNLTFPKSITSIAKDTLFKSMLQDSDNFIAEQLLLMIGDGKAENLNTNQTIRFVEDSLFSELGSKLFWFDGSGLSRYNNFQPSQLIYMLNEIRKSTNTKRLFQLFPIGGKSGTIADFYGGKKIDYVYAKTGTMTRVHSLSGFIVTSSGKVLIFSFMHEGFPFKTDDLKEEMEIFLEWIHDNY